MRSLLYFAQLGRQALDTMTDLNLIVAEEDEDMRAGLVVESVWRGIEH